jgi:hypothetical protein
MGKLIIENRTDMPDIEALWYVQEVMRDGRISNYGKQYCHATQFNNRSVLVWTGLNKNSDRFVVEMVED